MSFADGERRMLREARPNILIIGTDDAIKSTVSALVADMPGPVFYLTPDAPPPAEEDAEMFVVPDVAALSADRQHEWLAWIDDVGIRRRQIVTTSRVPVYPLVKQDAFLEALYYRLNTILLEVREYRRYVGL